MNAISGEGRDFAPQDGRERGDVGSSATLARRAAPHGGTARLPGTIETPILAEAGPHSLAAAFMATGAFFASYQLLRVGSINVTLADLMFFAAFAIGLARGQLTAIPFGRVTPLWLVGLAMMLGGLFIGTLFNGDMMRWFVISMQYITGFLLLPMLLLAQPRRIARRLVAMFILGVAAMEIFGIAVSQTMNHAQAAAVFSEEFIAGNGRLSTFASEPNWNGATIAFTTPLLIYAFSTRLLPTWLVTLIVPVFAWALMLSASFTGFAATVAAIAITLLFLGMRYVGGTLLVAAVGASIFVASGAPVPTVFEDRVGNAISSGDLEEAGTYKGRMKLIELAWAQADDTVFIGLGADQFRKTNEIKQPVHNIYLLMLVEGGLVSLAGILVLVGLLLWMPLSRLAHCRLEAGVCFAVVAVFILYSQSSPHIFSRLNIIPVLLALMIVTKCGGGIARKRYAGRPVRPLRNESAEIATGHPGAMR
ncbi:O-antigen ligase family protein [Stakelama saccharophila]|uniref:O-antigen ligase family protein n=1 Tax=Stakelama saccharophila TaxID=3075605 RepID=A0ABZ0B9W9_9SPHN|nr:O-antigen ligase family protein [Stakelama sp. W311]WNO54201.1 O-antigen ligase family protein [Stakelama sp. W311]